MTRVALYARYSDDKQSPHSIDDQFRICRMHAAKQAWEVVETYSDAGISGSTVVLRPGVQALLRDALAGKFDLVLAEALDRLSRDQEDIAGAYKRLRFAGVPIVTLSEGEITELHVGLKGTMNALFLKDLAAKTHRGIRGRVEAGKVGCGNAYGYRVVREIDAAGRVTTGEREIVPEEAEVVRRIFRDYAAGKSPRRIAIELNAEGVPAPWGSKWCDSSIRGNRALGSGIINNEFYVGEMVWNRRRRMKNPDTGRVEPRFNPESEWVHVRAPHLRIIEDDLWQAARQRQDSLVLVYEDNMAKSRTAAASANRRPKTLLSGLLVCGVCGGSVAKRGNNRFGCVSHIMGKGCTNTRTVNRDALEARVIAGLRNSLMAPEIIGEAMRTMVEETNRLNQQRRASHDVDVQRLEKARKAITGIVTAIEDGGYSRPLMERLKVLEAEVETLEAQMAEAPADVPDVHPNVGDLYRRKVERLVEALDRPEDHDHAAQALRAVIDTIVVTAGEKRGEVLVQLLGDFRKVIAWATERQAADREADQASCVEALSVPRASRAGMTVVWVLCGVGLKPLKPPAKPGSGTPPRPAGSRSPPSRTVPPPGRVRSGGSRSRALSAA
jgi:DNA invertase Pin-like site-specific DNA recombinase